MRSWCRLLSLALDYPTIENRSALRIAREEAQSSVAGLSSARRIECSFAVDALLYGDLMELQVRATELFDLGKGTSLRLFEHIHGDSRARGQAMVDLVDFYRTKGLDLDAAELPDHLCVVLEAAASMNDTDARALLIEMRDVVELLCKSHAQAQSPWTACLHGVFEMCGGDVSGLAALPEYVPENVDVDALWAEPEVGFAEPQTCSTGGQS